MKKILLIDGNSILNRAFYGTQSSYLKNAEGLYTGALFGFMNMYLKQIEEINPEYCAVAFDVKAPTFRHEKYPEYKAGRHAMPPELAAQFPVAKELIDAMGIARLELPGYEADDLLGTYSRIATENGLKCYIMTGDRDSLQLVNENVHVLLCYTQKGKPHTDEYDIAAVKEKYGVLPSQMIDLKALMGDSSDNIPGVPGVGEKTAAMLISQYETLDGVYANAENITKPALKSKISENKDLAYLSQMLGRIELFAPCEVKLEEMETGKAKNAELGELIDRLEFKAIRKKLVSLGILRETQQAIFAEESQDGELSLFSMMSEEQQIEEETKEVCCEEFASKVEKKLYVFIRNITGEYADFDLSYADNSVVYKSRKEIEPKIKELFESREIEKIMFDAKPFVLYLLKKGIKMNNIKHDLSVASYLLDSTRKSDNIEDVCRFLTGKQMPINVDILKIMSECAEEKLKADGMEKLYEEVEMPLINVLAEMEKEGFRVDSKILTEQGLEIDKTIENDRKAIFELSGHEFNINSPKQLGTVLFEELGLKAGKKTKSGYSTGQEVLENLALEHPIIPLIMEYRQNSKLKSTYIDGLLNVINPETNRVYSCFNQTVTATGRLSSTEPNLQNIPVRTELGKLIRKAFVPADENHILVDADYSQIELRVLAHMSGDEAMCKAFIEDDDIHTMTAAQVNGIPPEMVTPQMRSSAKAVNFGIVYGISDFGLARDLGISVYDAKKYIASYFKQYPGIEAFVKELVAKAKETGYAQTLSGRRRYLPELTSPKYMVRQFGERVAMNMPIQGTAADIIKLAMIRVNEALTKGGYKSKLILQVHDELLIDALKSEQQEVTQLLTECMQNAFNLAVPLKVDVHAAESWYECK